MYSYGRGLDFEPLVAYQGPPLPWLAGPVVGSDSGSYPRMFV